MVVSSSPLPTRSAPLTSSASGAVTRRVSTIRTIAIIVEAFETGDDLEQLRADRRFRTALDVVRKNNAVTETASERITTIVQSLKNFARLDEAELQRVDVREGLDSTLTLLHHVLKGRIEVVRHYGEIPPILCYPSQLNQVFMNVLANAAEAIKGEGTESFKGVNGSVDSVLR